eukprot:TRINITY_DN7679_c0_g1_i1.p1 TRINITY_DN7679_c0_g1~~TRINITY_DN7679_c0_g1_i1.p1  ORF type:complete len:226 (+),score=26.40 TRINITY_DN7679_c0_g1_i1:827-1504(+)
MIKFVLFKPLSDDVAEAVKHSAKKISFTVTWPKNEQSLESSTIVAIQKECFHISTPTTEQPNPSLAKAKELQNVASCLPLMYDKADIQGFGINDAIAKFQQVKNYKDTSQGFKQEYKIDVLPVCGRLALAAIPDFQSAQYELYDDNTIRARDEHPAWDTCLHVDTTNCRKAYYCWESAIKRMCAISPECCERSPDEQQRHQTHEACKRDPDNASYGCAKNLGLSG